MKRLGKVWTVIAGLSVLIGLVAGAIQIHDIFFRAKTNLPVFVGEISLAYLDASEVEALTTFLDAHKEKPVYVDLRLEYTPVLELPTAVMWACQNAHGAQGMDMDPLDEDGDIKVWQYDFDKVVGLAGPENVILSDSKVPGAGATLAEHQDPGKITPIFSLLHDGSIECKPKHFLIIGEPETGVRWQQITGSYATYVRGVFEVMLEREENGQRFWSLSPMSGIPLDTLSALAEEAAPAVAARDSR